MKKSLVRCCIVLLTVVCVACCVLTGCQLNASDRNEITYGAKTKAQYADGNVPLTDLAADYKGEATDSEGNLNAPFDVVYPQHFASGAYPYDKTAALLKFAKGYDGTVTRDLAACGFTSVAKVSTNADGSEWYRAEISDKTTVEIAVQKARSLKHVLMADYDYIYQSQSVDQSASDEGTTTTTSDGTTTDSLIDDVLDNIQVRDQWYLTACSIQRAWRFLKANDISAGGLPSVTVAVIDTGVDYNHPDLKANMWVNDGEIAANGIDDDGDGYVDDIHGCSTVSDDRFHSGDPMDDHGHGTHVAGIIAAANNRVGIVGVAYNAKIMAIKAGQATGVFLQSDIAEAIVYAYTHGADVINMSFGGSACSIAVQDALQQAYTTSTLVAAAGNESASNEPSKSLTCPVIPNYPAALSYVVGVMSVNAFGVESSFTNWDVKSYNSVEYEVYAPGEAMLSTLPNNRYGKLNGTSMATPVVSGIAALLRSYYTDRDMYPSKFISAQLCSTSGDVATCFDPSVLGHGPHNLPMIVNAYDALTKLPKPDVNLFGYYLFDSKTIAEANDGDGVIDAGETINIGAILRNRWGMSKDTVVSIDALSSAGIANPYVEIVTNSVNFDGVGTYSTKDNLSRDEKGVITGTSSDLQIKINDNCPNNYLVNLSITILFKNGIDEKDENIYQSKGEVSFFVRNGVLIPSRITEDLTLRKENYYISPKGFHVNENVTLTIEAGTTIEFFCDDKQSPYDQGGLYSVLVDGKLIVQGDENNLVQLILSEQKKGLSIQFASREKGEISMSYALVENIRLTEEGNIKYFDHCIFTDYGSIPSIRNAELYQCKFENWRGFVDYCYFEGCAFLQSNTISDYQSGGNIFRNCVIDTGLRKNNTVYMSSIGLKATSLTEEGDYYNITVHADAPVSGSGALYLKPYWQFLAEKLGGNLMNIEKETAYIRVLKSKLAISSVEELSEKITNIAESGDLGYFSGNAILNDYSKGDLDSVTTITAKGFNGTKPPIINIKGNYWGMIDKGMIDAIIRDYDDVPLRQDIVFDEILTAAPSNTFPFVVDAYVLNSKGERARTVSNETCTFVVEFNRDMDTTVPLRFRFGSSMPYAEYEVGGSYVTPRKWVGTYTLRTTIENGSQYLNISNGHAAGEPFLTLCDGIRFSFEIDTTAAQAMIMQGEATETGVQLTWQQDDFDTLLGYNVYRSDKEDGLYTRLNSYVLAADENAFFDNTVEPGKLYYYNFTVVKTDMQESTPSGKIVIRAMDTMAPNVYHSPVRTAYTGKNLIVSATITDNLQVSGARLYYRIKDGEWKSVAMYNNNSRYYGIVGAEYITLDGLEYYIDATDGVTHTYSGTAETPYAVTVKLAVDANSLGDVDGDGVITNKDALMLMQAANDLLNLTEEQFMRADINGDGELSAAEAMRILQYVSGKVTTIVD